MRPAHALESSLISLPDLADLPSAGDGYDKAAVEEAFAAFRHQLAARDAELKVVRASGGQGAPSGHSARLDALHLIRAAADFADTLERDASAAAARQIEQTAKEAHDLGAEFARREEEIEAYRVESERQRDELLARVGQEVAKTRLEAEQKAKETVLAAEATARRLVEKARHVTVEQSTSARAEVNETLSWANEQAHLIVARAQEGATQLLAAAGLEPTRAQAAVTAIVAAMSAPDSPESQA